MGRLLLPVLGALLVVSCAGKVFLETKLFTALPTMFQILLTAAYVIIILACCIGIPIYFVIYFHKSLYSDRGYIIHTLPVTTHQKLASKIISTYVLELLTFFVCLLSVLIILYDKQSFEQLYNLILSGDTQFKASMGISPATFLLVLLALIAVSVFAQNLMFYASVSIGQLFQNHKILGTIAGYMILNFAMQIIATVLLMLFGASDLLFDATANVAPNGQTILAIYGIAGCLCLLQAAAFYVVCYYFMEKKLNLN